MYDDLKLKKHLWFPWLIQTYLSVVMVNIISLTLTVVKNVDTYTMVSKGLFTLQHNNVSVNSFC